MGKLKRKMSQRFRPSVVARVLRSEWRAWKAVEADRSHLATTGDRPFVGCSPCEAAPLKDMGPARPNPVAEPRPPSLRETS
jgi:hypothetical protein